MPAVRLSHLLACAVVAGAAPARAEAPRVAADIAPIHSIASAMMAGVGAPDLIVPPGVSEHTYVLRPSEAAALDAAAIVFWVGPSLTPWLDEPIDALAGDARIVALAGSPGVTSLPIREGGPFEAHAEEEHAAGEEGEHAEAEVHGVSGVEDADHSEEGAPAAEGADPHLWLDPRNAVAVAGVMAAALSEVDPPNAAVYAANAEAFAAEMTALTAEIADALGPLRTRPYFVFHDAYQYFEAGFDFPASGSIALSDAAAPSAQRIAEIRDRIADESIVCAFAEPQHDPKLVGTVIEGTPTRTGTLDPVGAGLAPGRGHYPALLRGIAAELAACLGPET